VARPRLACPRSRRRQDSVGRTGGAPTRIPVSRASAALASAGTYDNTNSTATPSHMMETVACRPRNPAGGVRVRKTYSDVRRVPSSRTKSEAESSEKGYFRDRLATLISDFAAG
jgi:hypothetical protein